MQISNEDLFIQFYECMRKDATINEVYKNFGGGNIYIPSFKSLGRNAEIVAEYDKRIQDGQDKTEQQESL
ncbi:MAG: hypothetical protein LBG21_06635 [Campylobacteraceae bacterium]|nr:hypothetical protein [Campylobacteraceae bacterium]